MHQSVLFYAFFTRHVANKQSLPARTSEIEQETNYNILLSTRKFKSSNSSPGLITLQPTNARHEQILQNVNANSRYVVTILSYIAEYSPLFHDLFRKIGWRHQFPHSTSQYCHQNLLECEKEINVFVQWQKNCFS